MKKLLNPLIVSAFILVLVLGSVGHLMYGSCQTTKMHYMIQCYWMPDNLPQWLRVHEIYNKSIFRDKHYNGMWRCWYKDGSRKSITNYKNGRLNGELKHWYKNGRIEFIGVSKNKIMKTQKWHDDGLLRSNEICTNAGLMIYSENYRDGLLYTKTYYKESGDIKKREYFENDKIIIREEIDDDHRRKKIYLEGDIIIKTEDWDDEYRLFKKEYFDDKGKFKRRELFKDDNLMKIEIKESPE